MESGGAAMAFLLWDKKIKIFLIFILKTLKSIFVDEKFLTSKDK